MRRAFGSLRSAKLALIAAVCACSGCAGTAGHRPVPSTPESAQRAAQGFLDERLSAIETAHAGLELRWASPALEEVASCRASLVFRSPDRLRVRGTSAAFFTVFDLTADPDTIRFDIPRKRVLIRGARGDQAWSRFPLDPDVVAVALLAHPDPRGLEGASPNVRIAGADSLAAEGLDWTMTFDPATGLPRMYHAREKDVMVHWESWDFIDGVAWPGKVAVEWASTGDRLEAEFGRVQLGRPARESSFSEGPDEEREILSPSEGLERWREAMKESSESRSD
jgi:hypothetical protein